MGKEDKPTGKYRCLACGQGWEGSQLYHNPQILGGGWSCGDVFCGGTAVPIRKQDKGGREIAPQKEK